jgi:sulfite exporter TauE/SafE
MASTPVSRALSNEGQMDRRLRIIAGVVILALGVAYGSWWGLVGLIPVATGFVGFCPLYALLGIDTCADRTT